jgi:hypothetical protein
VLRRSLLVIAALLLLAGCGASHAKLARATLASRVRDTAVLMGSGRDTKVTCGPHACTITWKDNVWGGRPDWLGAFAEVVDLEDHSQYPSVHHFNIRVVDHRRRRVASFTCAEDKGKDGIWGTGKAQIPKDYGCVQALHRLT